MRQQYTDADVEAGGEAVLEHGLYEPDQASTGHLCIARDVLDAVAPSIVARALRDAADGYHAVEGNQHVSPPAKWLRRRADEIEAPD